MGNRHKLVSLQYLRGVAAVLVVLSHAQQMAPELPSIVPYFFGNFGVYLFFTLSGFLMIYVTDHKRQDPFTFWINRLLRVAPIYWIVTIGVFTLLSVAPQLGVGTEVSFKHLALSLLFIPHTTSADPETFLPMVRVGWTLIYEMYFYSVFSLSMIVTYSFRALLATLFMSMPIILQQIFKMQINDSLFLYVFGDLIVLQFVFGMLLARLALTKRGQSLLLAIGTANCQFFRLGSGFYPILIGIATISIMSAFERDVILRQPELRVIVYGFPSIFLLLAGLAFDYRKSAIFRIPLVLGEASYSVYLIHMLPLALIRFFYNNFLTLPAHIVTSVFFVLASGVISIAVGLAVYWLVEVPTLSIKKWFEYNRPTWKAKFFKAKDGDPDET